MRIVIRLFAGMRERAGTARLDLELPDGATVADALGAASEIVAGRRPMPSHVMTAVNSEYVERTARLRDGDELALIPPVSGGGEPLETEASEARGAPAAFYISITPEPLAPEPLIDRVRADEDGAVVTFLGVTRNSNAGRRVLHLEYEAYQPMAEKKIAAVAHEIRIRWEIDRVAVAHRVGRVDIGETSMIVAVSAPHRRSAFEAALHFIDRLKEIVPIWKKEYFEGGEVWIGESPGERR